MCPSPDVQVRRLAERDLGALERELPLWNAVEYRRRLAAQGRGELVQVVAWSGDVPVGRGTLLFPAHEEYSTSADRERCAEVRDVFVHPDRRRRGVARAVMAALEASARERGMRVGLSVALAEGSAPARALYDALGYVHAHGPFVSSTNLDGDDGPFPVGAVMTYLVREP